MKYYSSSILLLLSTQVQSFAIPTPIIDFAIGGIAGGAGALAAYPLDFITAQMQTETTKYKNGYECFIDTIQQGGPGALYKGATVQVLGIAPEKAIKLNVNDLIKHMLSSGGTLSLGGEVMSGAIAGLCQVIATSPLETIKVALQTSDKSFGQVMEEIGGVGGLFHGAQACMVRDIVFTALLFPIYSHLRMIMPDFCAGSIAGVIATFVATPADVVKTRILSEDTPRPTPPPASFGVWSADLVPAFAIGSPPQQLRRAMSATAMSAMRKNVEPERPSLERNPFMVGFQIYEKEGPMVLLSGVIERCMGSIPRFGLTLTMYDVLKTMVADANLV